MSNQIELKDSGTDYFNVVADGQKIGRLHKKENVFFPESELTLEQVRQLQELMEEHHRKVSDTYPEPKGFHVLR